jgi:hypothetical protein
MRRALSTIDPQKWQNFCCFMSRRIYNQMTDSEKDSWSNSLYQRRSMRIMRLELDGIIVRTRANKKTHQDGRDTGLRYTHLILAKEYKIYVYEPYVIEKIWSVGTDPSYPNATVTPFMSFRVKSLPPRASIKTSLPLEELEELLMTTLLQDA